MRVLKSALLAAFAAGACSLSFAQACKKPAPLVTVISKVAAAPFQLKEIARKDLADGSSASLYKGETILTITPCDPAAAPTDVPVVVSLHTVTALNDCGDGLTNGEITLYAPSTRQAITGSLVAVNKTFGDLTGIIDGRMGGFGASGARLRAAFHGVFVQDADGKYTLVNVDASGVQLTTQRPGPKK